MILKALNLMRDILEESAIPPDKLHVALGKYYDTLDQFLKMDEVKAQETEYLMVREIMRETEAFMSFLELCNQLTGIKVIEKK
ncbi:MAG TPA: hypothetical protein VD908_18745 [Cytophagales bacterium]|nr:hypothetical protein [Cytophagales bacterium]